MTRPDMGVSETVWDSGYAKKAGTIEPEVRMLALRIRELGFRRVLDAGCGAGRHVAYLAREGFEVFAVDQFEAAAEKTRALLTGEELKADIRVLKIRVQIWSPAQVETHTKSHQILFSEIVMLRMKVSVRLLKRSLILIPSQGFPDDYAMQRK